MPDEKEGKKRQLHTFVVSSLEWISDAARETGRVLLMRAVQRHFICFAVPTQGGLTCLKYVWLAPNVGSVFQLPNRSFGVRSRDVLVDVTSEDDVLGDTSESLRVEMQITCFAKRVCAVWMVIRSAVWRSSGEFVGAGIGRVGAVCQSCFRMRLSVAA